MKTVWEDRRSLPISEEADVVVVGGGAAGIAAALAAARVGRSVILIEHQAFLGGNMTLPLPLLGYLDRQGKQIIGGIAEELVAKLRVRGGADVHRPCPLHVSYTIVDAEQLKSLLLEEMMAAGVKLLLYTTVVGVVKEGNNIQCIVVESKSGREAIRGNVFVDASGDGDLAVQAGAPYELGDGKGEMQPPTLVFTMGGVDTDALKRFCAGHPEFFADFGYSSSHFLQNDKFIAVGMRRVIEAARKAGESAPAIDRIIMFHTMSPGEMAINMTRPRAIDGTNNKDLTRGEMECRAQIPQVIEFLRRRVPGFETARLLRTSHKMGLRETRRIMGEYVLTGADIMEARPFDDAIGQASYFIDVHHGSDDGFSLEFPQKVYGLPYRSLLPKEIDNLLVAGRCISCTREAMGAIRVMPTCMALGQAAGVAASLSARERISPKALYVHTLQSVLKEQGAILP